MVEHSPGRDTAQEFAEHDNVLPSKPERIRLTEQSGRSIVAFNSSEQVRQIRLWDNVDLSWTSPIEAGMAIHHCLRKVVFKCSACTETSVYDRDVATHIRRVRESYEIHKNAQMQNGGVAQGTTLIICSGCGGTFSNRKNQAGKHLEGIHRAYSQHRHGAKELVLFRFSLAPSALVSPQSDARPELQQVERSGEVRRRRRRRRRNR